MATVDPTKNCGVNWEDHGNDPSDAANRLTVAWLDDERSGGQLAYTVRGLHAYWIAQCFKARDRQLDERRKRIEQLEEAERQLRDRLRRARALIVKAADGGLTDYSDLEPEPICGFCGYEVECCERKGWDDDGQPFTEDNPCPGIEARAFIKETKEAT